MVNAENGIALNTVSTGLLKNEPRESLSSNDSDAQNSSLDDTSFSHSQREELQQLQQDKQQAHYHQNTAVAMSDADPFAMKPMSIYEYLKLVSFSSESIPKWFNKYKCNVQLVVVILIIDLDVVFVVF